MKLNVRQAAVFAVLGSVMYASKVLMEILPNVHLIGVFIVAFTIVYRQRALYPIYIYVFLHGLFQGFNLYWIPNLYTWAVLWGVVMLLPRNMPKKIAPIVYMVVCALHGFLYGTLYAPAQMLLFDLTFDATIAWIIAGLPWDFVHGVSNFLCGSLITPISAALKRAEKFSQ